MINPAWMFAARRLVGEVSSISGAWSRVDSWMREANLCRVFITDTMNVAKRYVLDMVVPHQQ